MFSMHDNILFVYAHMDDEAIQSYGTIRRFVQEGKKVTICCLCGDGRLYKDQESRKTTFEHLIKTVYGNSSYTLKFSDLTLSKKDVMNSVQRIVNEVKPDTIFTHSIHDLHSEHRLVAEQMLVICRNTYGSTVRNLYFSSGPQCEWSYDTYGKFSPNVFVDISKYRGDKISALELYNTELPTMDEDLRSASSIICWNDMWGRVSGTQCSEPYELIFSRS